MTKIIGIILIIAGGVLLFRGFARQDSLVGQASEVGTEVANAVDGGGRQPQHVVMLLGGGALLVAGAVLLLRRGSSG